MIECTEKSGAVCFAVTVVPRASRSEITSEHDGALRVRLAAAPVDGKANEELLRTLAKFFDVPLRAVEIAGGHSSKSKRICIAGLNRAGFEAKLRVLKSQ